MTFRANAAHQKELSKREIPADYNGPLLGNSENQIKRKEKKRKDWQNKIKEERRKESRNTLLSVTSESESKNDKIK